MLLKISAAYTRRWRDFKPPRAQCFSYLGRKLNAVYAGDVTFLVQLGPLRSMRCDDHDEVMQYSPLRRIALRYVHLFQIGHIGQRRARAQLVYIFRD